MYVLVFFDGLRVNGIEFVVGLVGWLFEGVMLMGGFVGDGVCFGEMFVFCVGVFEKDMVVVLGLYGSWLKVGFGLLGGWDFFGLERVVIKFQVNVLFELDGYLVFGFYKQYFGEQVKGLLVIGFLFLLSICMQCGEVVVVCMILLVDEVVQSLMFVGDIFEGVYVWLMKVNFDWFIDGVIGVV